MDDSAKDRIRKRLLRIDGKFYPRPAVTVRKALESEWDFLCWLAEYYGNSAARETWKDAEGQWRKVAAQAVALREALESLGELACAIRLDAEVQDQGLSESVKDFLPGAPGNVECLPLWDLQGFAERAGALSAEMKKKCNGARKEDDSGGIAFLISMLRQHLACPTYHAQMITQALVASGRVEDFEPDPRFGERAVKRLNSDKS